MRRELRCVATVLVLSFMVVGCATSRDITAHSAPPGTYRSAYVVAHGDRSSDVDASIQRELFRRGLSVSSGPEGKQPEAVDLIVKYADSWNWDVTMYLKSLDIQMFDAHSKTLVATATWKNSVMHGFHGLDGVVAELVSGMLTKLGIKTLSS
jgi:hypothetical protein